jgi:hypothetical protein
VAEGAAAFADVAGWALLAMHGTLDYLLRDMAHPEGGFYSAEVRVRYPSSASLRFSLANLAPRACSEHCRCSRRDRPPAFDELRCNQQKPHRITTKQPSRQTAVQKSDKQSIPHPKDADSLDPASGEKKEGAFYVWSSKEASPFGCFFLPWPDLGFVAPGWAGYRTGG